MILGRDRCIDLLRGIWVRVRVELTLLLTNPDKFHGTRTKFCLLRPPLRLLHGILALL